MSKTELNQLVALLIIMLAGRHRAQKFLVRVKKVTVLEI